MQIDAVVESGVKHQVNELLDVVDCHFCVLAVAYQLDLLVVVGQDEVKA